MYTNVYNAARDNLGVWGHSSLYYWYAKYLPRIATYTVLRRIGRLFRRKRGERVDQIATTTRDFFYLVYSRTFFFTQTKVLYELT